jgi:hypothetical protein
MSTTRAPGGFAGTGKLWINGTLVSEAARVSGTVGGRLNRVVTLGHTGETTEDPTMMELKIDGSPLRSSSYVATLRRLRRSGSDVTVKVKIGDQTYTGRGKIGPMEVSTENGKSTFATSFMGDEQEV